MSLEKTIGTGLGLSLGIAGAIAGYDTAGTVVAEGFYDMAISDTGHALYEQAVEIGKDTFIHNHKVGPGLFFGGIAGACFGVAGYTGGRLLYKGGRKLGENMPE